MVTEGVVATTAAETVQKKKKECERVHVWEREKEITSAALLTDIFHKLIQLT